ncbi:MAG TPA: DUF6152 family protein [Gammaproteobacteria bacterium]|nr:DUF6152 family protein [Gammaproteobacteria bacterium]
MKLKITSAALAASVVLVAARPLAAHHSAAMFDETKVVELSGTVKALQWTNPHVWLQVMVGEKGSATEWSFEGGSPNSLSRQGWRSTTFKPGDVVTVRMRPMKDGTAAGQFIGAKFAADGHTVGRWE